MCAPKKKAQVKPVKKKVLRKRSTLHSRKEEAVEKFIKALRKKRKADVLAEPKNGKAGVLTPVEPPKTVVGCGLTQPTDKDESCITIGSDCAGLCSEGIALELLGVKRWRMFACEQNPSARLLLYQADGNNAMIYYSYVTRTTRPRAQGGPLGLLGRPASPAALPGKQGHAGPQT